MYDWFLQILIAIDEGSDFIPDPIETLGSEIGNAWPILLAIGAILGGFRWLWKKAKDEIISEIRPINEQFQNNGGASLRDAVDELNHKIDKFAPFIVDRDERKAHESEND
jgi:hypothetical protein